MPLLDEYPGVVDALGQPELEHLGLETTFKEVLDLEGQTVIQLHAALVQDTDADKTTKECIA